MSQSCKTTNSDVSRRVAIWVFALGLCALSANVFFLCNLFLVREPLGTQDVSRYVRRLDPVRKYLPAGGAIGYVSDDLAEEGTAKARLYLARYALSPVIIERTEDRPVVLGNFLEPSMPAKVRIQNMVLDRDFGDGVAVFRRVVR
jgi:hypothetical protein